MRHILLAIILLFGINGHAAAECMTLSALQQDIATKAPDYTTDTVANVSGDAAQPLVKFWDRLPPAGHTVADQVVVFRGTNRHTNQTHPLYIIALLKEGCIVDKGMVPSSMFRGLLPSI
jgi:hypothetical protein